MRAGSGSAARYSDMGLRVTLLPTCHGSDSQLQPLTSFLINDRVAVDAGCLGLSVEPGRQHEVTDVIVTHPHIDHTGALPVHIAAAYTSLTRPVRVYATEPVVAALRDHLFNEVLWPDFTQIPLLNSDRPAMEYVTVEEGETFEIAGMLATAIPVNHVVPTIGVVLRGEGASVAFTSDTYRTDALWETAGRRDDLAAVFVDCSYPNALGWLAEKSGHMTPEVIADEMRKLGRDAHVYAVHIKPSDREKVIAEIGDLALADFSAARIGREYAW